jgi:hypothetical protein
MLPNLFLSSESCFSEFRRAALCAASVFFAVTPTPYTAFAVFLTTSDARQPTARFIPFRKIAHHDCQAITVSGKQLYSSIHALVAGVNTRHPRRSTTTVSSIRRPNAPGI